MKILILCLMMTAQVVHANKLQLLGEGRLTFLFFKVYDAKLFAEKKSTEFDQKLRLEISYLRSLKGDDIYDRTLTEWKGIGLSEERINAIKPLIKDKFPNVDDGDQIIAEYDPVDGLKVILNKKKVLITSSDVTFAKDFMGIWLSPETSEKKLRAKLFGVE